ncbi:hypothetical protein Vafri_1289 [Volvox africanus]|nr:hypothetical protein Vafri_1289 [Volvox africanus]
MEGCNADIHLSVYLSNLAVHKTYSYFLDPEPDFPSQAGVCAVIENYGTSCIVSSDCRDAPSNGLQSCPSYQSCTILLDTDLNGAKILTSGESNSADSAEDCCFQCAQTKGCNTWTWCADATGCNGQRYRFRQCWLKQADPNNPQPKKSYGGSPGWISGVRQAWLPAK